MNLKQNSIFKYKSIIIKIVERTSKKKDGFYDASEFKSTDGSPACVKSETKAKLIERGWASN